VPAKTFVPLLGLGAVAATAVGVAAPVGVGATADNGPNERVVDLASTAAPANGALESCSAYFGFGKVDMVTFDVELESGTAPGALPTVGNGIDVALVMTLQGGGEVRCAPVEVTEEVWTTFWSTNPLSSSIPGFAGPAFPGPGRYFYPAVKLDPEINGNVVTDVAFEVTNVPAPFTLVSPAGTQLLPAIVSTDEFEPGPLTPGFYAYIEAQAGTDAADALEAAFDACLAGGDPVQSDALDVAWQAVVALLPPDAGDAGEFSCDASFAIVVLTPTAEALAAANQTATIAIAGPAGPGPDPGPDPGPGPSPDPGPRPDPNPGPGPDPVRPSAPDAVVVAPGFTG